jgi:MOSC domain-containing protein YiiM
VTAPRVPCQIFQAWMGEPHWVKRFTTQGDVGAYLRVLRPGTVRAGDPIDVLDRPAHGVTVREVFNAADADPDRLRRLLDEGGRLHPSLVTKVNKVLGAPRPPKT